MNWYAIYTKAKAEDSTTQLLRNAGLEILSPKIVLSKFVRGKYTAVTEPLFPCYIFGFFDRDKHVHMIKYTRGVKYIVGKENPLEVPQEIIDAIKERMDGEIVKAVAEELKKGDRVLIKDGPFSNFYGIFEQNISGNERAMILLEAIHCKLDIDSRALKRV